jgi:hypothetical protein
MELKTNNLYANGKIIEFDDGEQILTREKYTIDDFKNFEYFPVTENSNLSDIAYKAYFGKAKDPSKYWGIIADVNNVFDPFDLSDFIGEDFFIPDVLEVKLLLNKK